jgi:uncharacterized protein (DUF983 family)
MQNVSCPSCGAQVAFRSHASVMAVCEFCKTTVLKDADSVKDAGKMSDVLEDYSPIQIGTSGTFGSHAFTVIGRIQLRYPDGLWNEWYLMFDDGNAAWLGDASGQYMLTTERPADPNLPLFDQLAIGAKVPIDGKLYVASDIRTANCTGGQGELPFRVGEGWQARVADLRSGEHFVTLDYSDGDKPTLYAGHAVTLASLKCQLLRDDDQVLAAAGKVRGKVSPLSCPSCGSAVNFVPGMTTHLVCPSCQAQVDTSGAVATVIAAGERVAAVHTTLELGAKATIAGNPFEVIGLMRRADDENTEWTEYLMHHPRFGFVWIVETDEGWWRADVLDNWPERNGDAVRFDGKDWKKLYDYPARVTFAAGAFNWRVRVGDTVHVTEFESGRNTLAAEKTHEELSWSMSTPVPPDMISAWFEQQIAAKLGAAKTESGSMTAMSRRFIIGLLLFNSIPLLATFGRTWLIILIAIAALYIPAWYLDSHND